MQVMYKGTALYERMTVLYNAPEAKRHMAVLWYGWFRLHKAIIHV